LNGLQLHGKWVKWAGRAGAGSGYLPLGFIHNGLMGFYPDHKSLLCKVTSRWMTVAIFWRGSLYLLFCKYRDKKLRPGSHPALAARGGITANRFECSLKHLESLYIFVLA